MTMFELRSFAKDAVKQVKKYLPKEYQSVDCEITESGKNNVQKYDQGMRMFEDAVKRITEAVILPEKMEPQRRET